ncbi:MAG: GTP-binding protein [Promethearchaeota archaeon]
MSKRQDKYKYKITVIGDGMVGKTSLIKKFTKGSFEKDYIKTIGAQFSNYKQDIENDQCELVFWDIAGQDEFHFLRPSFYKNSSAAIIVYSLEDNSLGKESFKNITHWYSDLKHFCGDIPVILFANKIDLVDKKQIETKKIEKLVEKKNFIGYYLTSAKTGERVYDGFLAIINELYYKSKALYEELTGSK